MSLSFQHRLLIGAITLVVLGVLITLAYCVFVKFQEKPLFVLSDTQQELLDSVSPVVDKVLAGEWDKKLDVRGMDITGQAAHGKWVQGGHYWDWIAWRSEDETWKVLVGIDGFDCEELKQVPPQYAEFFHNIVNTPFGPYCYRHGYTPIRYWNEEAGFALVVPEAWERVGYSVKKEVQADGVLLFRFMLQSKDQNGSSSDFATASLISATPVDKYVEGHCGYGVACNPGKWVGENHDYVFVSEYFSPEAFGICTKGTPGFDQAFYDRNTDLCDNGRTTSYPERIPGGFSISKPQ